MMCRIIIMIILHVTFLIGLNLTLHDYDDPSVDLNEDGILIYWMSY